MRRTLSLLVLLAACAMPGTDVVPAADDFALLEVKLRG
jgi:hypothetical protein